MAIKYFINLIPIYLVHWKKKKVGILDHSQFSPLNIHLDCLFYIEMMQLMALKSIDHTSEAGLKCMKKETELSWSNGSTENSCDITLDISRTPVMNSAVSSQLNSTKHLFPSSLRPTSMSQLLQGSSRSDLQCLKIDQVVQDESFCNMFNGNIEDQHNFWPWP